MLRWIVKNARTLWRSIARFGPLILVFAVTGLIVIGVGNYLGLGTIWGGTLLSVGSSLLAIGLVTVTAEVVASANIMNAFRLYGDHVDHGIVRVFPSREDSEYEAMREKARARSSSMRLLTLVGRDHIRTPQAIEGTRELAASKDLYHHQILLPGCEHWKIQYHDFEPEDLDVIGCERRKGIGRRFGRLQDELAEVDGAEARFFDRKPVFRIEWYDELMLVSFYGLDSRAVYSPIFALDPMRDSEVVDYFKDQFEEYWRRGDRT